FSRDWSSDVCSSDLPCPNDTFIFDALIHHKIDTRGLDFAVEYHDVETLNQKAFRQELDITKLSYHAFAYAVEDYELLDAGSALRSEERRVGKEWMSG